MKAEEKTKIKELYNDPKIGLTSVKRFYNNLREQGYKYTQAEIEEVLSEITSIQVHTEKKQVFLPIEVGNVRDQFQVDLIVLINTKKKIVDPVNNIKKTDLRYILCCIDVFSRKASCQFIKDKTSTSTGKALSMILQDLGVPKQISGDKGREWEGHFRELCERNNIRLVLKDKDGKFSNGIVERFNRTLLGYIKRYKSDNRKKGINQIAMLLPEFVENYNNSIHRSIGLTPKESFEKNIVADFPRPLTDLEYERTHFKIGDIVRVRKEQTVYTKGRAEQFSRNVFKIIAVTGNVYTLSAEYEGKKEYSYNALIKVDISPEELEKQLLERKREITTTNQANKTRASNRIAQKKRKETLRPRK